MNKNSIWNNFSGSTHAYTTGRRHIDSNLNKIRPKGPSQTLKVGDAPSRNCAMSSSTFTLPTQQPGKLNMKNFQLVSDAVAKMNFSSSGSGSMADSYLAGCEGGDKSDPKRYDHAQLDGEDEDSEELAEYEQIYENEGKSEKKRERSFNLLTCHLPQTAPSRIAVPVQRSAVCANRMPTTKPTRSRWLPRRTRRRRSPYRCRHRVYHHLVLMLVLQRFHCIISAWAVLQVRRVCVVFFIFRFYPSHFAPTKQPN